MPAFERLSSGFGTFGFVGVIWIDSYSPRTQALLGLAVVRRIVSTSIEMLQSGRIRTTQKTLGKHEKVRILSSPLKNPGFPRVFRISGQLLWLSCLSMHVHACRCCVVLCAALDPKNISVSRPVSRQSRPRTLVFQGRTCGFVAEVQDSNSLSSNRSRVHCRNADIEIATRVPRYRMLIHRLATGGYGRGTRIVCFRIVAIRRQAVVRGE
jgi:hypothetical protein